MPWAGGPSNSLGLDHDSLAVFNAVSYLKVACEVGLILQKLNDKGR